MSWRIKEELRTMIEFQQLTLIGAWPPMEKVDIVWLRNVLIYFDVEANKEIFRKIRNILRPDGYMFLGGAETTMNLDEHFERLPFNATSCYRLADQSSYRGELMQFLEEEIVDYFAARI